MRANEILNSLEDQFTPSAVVDLEKLTSNIERMNAQIARFKVDLRPHVKTTKSIPIARKLTEGYSGAITVSTLTEAEYFADGGFTDILYAVGIVPAKLRRVAALMDRGVSLHVILDSTEAATMVSEWGEQHGYEISVLLEINSDDHRAGIDPGDRAITDIAKILFDSSGAHLRGIMTHAGASYDCRSVEQIRQLANQERDAVLDVAATIRAKNMPCEIVSIGSTPTALFASDLEGITEVRAGVYAFLDLFQAGLGCCEPADIALSVLTSVIGHKKSQNMILTDAGGLALSKDRGTAAQSVDRKYGLVCDAKNGRIIENLIVQSVNQEHGLLSTIDGTDVLFEKYPIGTQLRILPNHACMTAAAYDQYIVVEGAGSSIIDSWQRCGGWQ